LSLVPIDVKEKNFQTLMLIYEQAMLQVKRKLESFQTSLKEFYNYDVINNINCRIKTPESIINKMKKKNYDLNYKELIGNVNDIAGIRIVCPFKTDIFKIKDTIEEDSLIEILEIKDYVHKPKKTGYSGFHIIGQTPVNIGDTIAQVKIEIQIRTMAMDFWSTVEHKIKYKAKNKLSKFDSMKMIHYAKIINKVDTKITKINSKYLG
jgi:putative GTP pyrophosphokinase